MAEKTKAPAAGDKPKTERKNANAGESKADKFRRLAKKRVPAALAKIRLIGNLGGSGYEYTPEQVAKIETALKEASASVVEKLNAGLKGSAAQAKEDFDI